MEEEVKNTEFNASGNGAPKKAVLPLIIAIVLIAAICCCAYFTMGAKTPEKFFKTAITKALSENNKANSNANYEVTLDVDVTEPEGQETPVVKVLNALNGKVTTKVTDNAFNVGIYVDREGKVVIDADVIATVDENKAYVRLAPIIDQYVEYEYEESELNVRETIEAARQSTEEMPKERLDILNREFTNLINPEKASKESETIEVGGKSVKATAYIYKTTVNDIKEALTGFCDTLLNSEEFMATYDEKGKETIKESLEGYKETLADLTDTENPVTFKVYVKGFTGSNIVRVSYEVENPEEGFTNSAVVDVLSEKEYAYTIKNRDEEEIKGTVTIDKESDEKVNVVVVADYEGYNVKIMATGTQLKEVTIPEVSSLETVKMEELNSWTLLANLLGSEAYKIYTEIMPADDSASTVEAVPFDDTSYQVQY